MGARFLSLVLLASCLLGAARPLAADEVDEVRRAIRERGAAWFADQTPLTRLAPDERRLRTGAIPASVATGSPQLKTAPVGPLPSHLDWRDAGVVTRVKNQGGCGSCWAFAATSAFESSWLLATGQTADAFDRAEQDVLSCSHAGSCQSGFTEGALQYITDRGVVDEDCMAYQGQDLPCADRCWSWPGRVRHARGSAWVENTVPSLKAALQQGPITACFSVYDDFYSYSGGVYEHVWGGTSAAHSVTLVGYDDATQAWLCKNSWGEQWGEHGYFRIRYGEIDFGWCATAVWRNHAPEIPWIPVLQATPGQPLEVALPVTDADGDTLHVFADLPAAMEGASFDPDALLLSWTPGADAVGVHHFTLVARDDWEDPQTVTAQVAISVCPVPCDDDDVCTDDLCSSPPAGAGGEATCRHEWNEAPCDDDGNSCTLDQCADGQCHAVLPDGSPCEDDGNPCTEGTCQAGACVQANLAEGAACPDDGSDCTDDVCQQDPGRAAGALACLHPLKPEGAACRDDGDACTADACRDGWCQHEALPDGTPCAFDDGSCSQAACLGGVCNWTAAPDGTPCDDRLACTDLDACVNGSCRGTPPPECQDAAPCTLDACADGPGFERVDEPFEDVAAWGTDLGLDGDDVAAGPFSPGFALPLPGGEPRTALWVSSNGLVSFGGPVASPLNDCLPSVPAPNDLLAVLWDDLECSRALGCRAYVAAAGEAPGRRVVVQWDGLRVHGVLGARLSFQAVLFEDGRVDLRYRQLDGADGSSASVGFEGPFGTEGLAWSCGEQRLAVPTALRYDPTVTWRCESWPEKGTCQVGDACVPEWTPNPDNPCEACQPWISTDGYTPADGNGCDDGDPCTYKDACWAGTCQGLPSACPSDACADRGCDGWGGCNEAWHEGACDDGDTCTTADACVNGRCEGKAEPDGTPCDDGVLCTSADACFGGRCTGAAPAACDDGLACTLDVCLDQADAEAGTPFACKHALVDLTCLIDGACYEAKQAHPKNPCERCDPGWSTDAWASFDWQPCDDGDPCTYGETCVAGVCGGTAYACGQGGPCRVPRCDGFGACLYDLVEGPCDDGNPCTDGDACDQGECASGAPVVDGTPCDDGLACTAVDACHAGACAGQVPPECADALPCTDDGCIDGAQFQPGGGAFDDLSADGTPIAVPLYGEKGTALPLGFDLPWFGGTRTVAWPSPRGFVALTGGGVDDAPNLWPDVVTCLPDPSAPNDLVALYWRDLDCTPENHCSLRWALRGTAPDRAFVLQWTNAHPAWQDGPSLTAQVALFESGAVELRYAKLVGLSGKEVTIGLEGPDGAVGASVACGDAEVGAGTSLRWEPGRASACTHRPAEGWCAIDGACVADGTPNPANPCEACRDRASAWLPAEGTPCDDGNPCTFDDACWLGSCAGQATRCDPGPCEVTSACDGQGGCAVTWALPGTLCGKASCQADIYTAPSACDAEGACVEAEPVPCWPFRCATFTACGTTCHGPDDCAKDAFCDPVTSLCHAPLPEGEACLGGKQCASGWCSNGFCCEPDGPCCAADADCPPPPEPLTCLDPARCQSQAVHATCGKGHRCEYGLVDDDTGCGPSAGPACGYYADRPCDGTPDQPEGGCVPSCTDVGGCDPDARCEDGVCVPLYDDGTACSADAQCGSGHCDHGTCCKEGACCRAAADCAGAEAPTCDNPARCQGWRRDARCTERFTCEAVVTDDDTACDATHVADCGPLADHACDGGADQPFFTCPAGCTADAGCDPGLTCRDGACEAPVVEPDAGEPTHDVIEPQPEPGPEADLVDSAPEAEPHPETLAPDAPDDAGSPGGGGGCSTGPTRPSGTLLLALAALLALHRRRWKKVAR
jgi:MYXO-CTERM domain-containing protein